MYDVWHVKCGDIPRVIENVNYQDGIHFLLLLLRQISARSFAHPIILTLVLLLVPRIRIVEWKGIMGEMLITTATRISRVLRHTNTRVGVGDAAMMIDPRRSITVIVTVVKAGGIAMMIMIENESEDADRKRVVKKEDIMIGNHPVGGIEIDIIARIDIVMVGKGVIKIKMTTPSILHMSLIGKGGAMAVGDIEEIEIGIETGMGGRVGENTKAAEDAVEAVAGAVTEAYDIIWFIRQVQYKI